MKDIKLATPAIGIRETLNVVKAMATKEISGYSQQYVSKFERDFASKIGVKYALSVNSGTSAITLAVRSLNIKAGDKVAVSALTNMATYFPLLQIGAIPIPVDVNPLTLNMDISSLVEILDESFKAVIVVHLYGLPADMNEITKVTSAYNIPVIEDCAESLGASQNHTQTGAMGRIGCFSFYANKLITTGEGGMLTTNDLGIYEYAKSLRSLGFGKENKFLHQHDGYNFRLSNIQAAIGAAQLKRLNRIVELKRKVARRYNTFLADIDEIQLPVEPPGFFSVYWMYTIILKEHCGLNAQDMKSALAVHGIESREGFISYADQIHLHKQYKLKTIKTPIASQIQSNIIYLPSSINIRKSQQVKVVDALISILNSQ